MDQKIPESLLLFCFYVKQVRISISNVYKTLKISVTSLLYELTKNDPVVEMNGCVTTVKKIAPLMFSAPSKSLS